MNSKLPISSRACHNGVTASGKTPTHINATDVCDACHYVYPAQWAPVMQVDHNQVLGTCSSCHNGVLASGKNAAHIPTTFDCSVCHTTTAWLPVIN
ncbi:MAG: hypothetical protein L0Z73_01560 [Gammaproteobacteria bacterium]|nr:hypothetical protein [Gammaproteobacteria bacterium]